MRHYANSTVKFSNHYFYYGFLLSCWMSGLLLGCVFGIRNVTLFSSMMRAALGERMSIVSMFLNFFFPLIITYLSVVIEKPIYILIVCFFKAAAYGFTGVLISYVFHNASWLIRLLFQFSDSCLLCVLMILWFYKPYNPQLKGNFDVKLCAVLGVLIAILDYCVISPYLQRLF